MRQLRGQIDENDFQYMYKRRHEMPIAVEPCPLKDGKIHPTTTRFYWKNGQMTDVVHIKPIYYFSTLNEWRPLTEVASYFGNKRGMTLKTGWEDKMNFSYLVWYMKRQELLKGWGVKLEYLMSLYGQTVGALKVPLLMNPTDTFFPDPSPTTTSVDGRVGHEEVGGVVWTTLTAAAGSFVADNETDNTTIGMNSDPVTDKWNWIQRGIFLFDTSSIPDANTIDSATFSIEGSSKTDNLSITPNINAYSSAPASNTALVGADYATLGSTAFSTVITYANYSTTAYNDFALNASGLTNISKTGVSKFGLRNANYDVANTAPTWGNNLESQLSCRFAETAGTGSDPKLVVTHSVAGGGGMFTLLGVGN